jgi:hypothetical protein
VGDHIFIIILFAPVSVAGFFTEKRKGIDMLIGFCTMSTQCPAMCNDREIVRLGVERSTIVKALCMALTRECPLIKLQYIDCVSEIDDTENIEKEEIKNFLKESSDLNPEYDILEKILPEFATYSFDEKIVLIERMRKALKNDTL